MYLNCHSQYSLRYGTLSIQSLVENAQRLGLETLVLTDINAMSGVFDFAVACGKTNIHPIVGIEFRNEDDLKFIGIARNLKGFKELNDLLSYANCTKLPFPDTAPAFQHCHVVYPFGQHPQQLQDNEWIGIKVDQVNRLISERYRTLLPKCVIHHPVTIYNQASYELHKALRAIDRNVVLDKLQPHQFCAPNEHMVNLDRLLSKYERFPKIAENTQLLLKDCSFDFDFSSPKNKKFYTETQYEDKLLLEKLAFEGMHRRYGKAQDDIVKRVRKELKIIDQLCFGGYFLITWDIIQHSKSLGYYHVGRGSGANSIVAYCLGITDVDPIELDLYFERFLNPSRTSPPDFDIDWSHKTRDDILNYIFERYGKEHAAFCGTIGTFRYRSPIRELGKVYGLPKEEIDALTRSPKQLHGRSAIVNRIHRLSSMMEGTPNLRSMHACGILISEHPITNYVALDLPPKGFTVAQIDMYMAEDIGFEKLDILSQRGLSSIDSTIRIIEEQTGQPFEIHDVEAYKTDPNINENLSKGKTLGCFYIESPAMRGLLRRLKCDNYRTLVAASSVIRPGVAKSGMMREYIKRHNSPGTFEFLHPTFEKHLGETYGIMVYQEDVIKIAHHFGGLDLADADILRRAMSGKTRSKAEFDRVKEHFFENCRKRNYPEQLIEEVYRQILSFAGYSFCKAHSASYSVESYQSLYLKTYYPLEFIVGVINNFGGFYRTEVYVHEAKMYGGTIHTPCVNTSEYLTSLHGKDIFLGFVHLQGFDRSLADRIVEQRQRFGNYLDAEDFVRRTQIGWEQLRVLIFVGALRFTGQSKAALTLRLKILLNHQLKTKAQELFAPPSKQFKLPQLERGALEDAYDEIEHLGFPVSLTQFELLERDHPSQQTVDDLNNAHHQHITIVGQLLSIKSVPTAKGDMNFGTWIDREGAYFDTAHFPDALQRFPFKGPGCYVLQGKVVIDYHFPTIEIQSMQHLKIIPDPRFDDQNLRAKLPKTSELKGTPLPRKPYPSKHEVNQLFGNETNKSYAYGSRY